MSEVGSSDAGGEAGQGADPRGGRVPAPGRQQGR